MQTFLKLCTCFYQDVSFPSHFNFSVCYAFKCIADKNKNVSTNLYFFLPDVSDIFTGPANHIKCQLKHSPNLCTTFTNDFCFFFKAISVLHFVECRCLSEAISACHAAALQRILIRQEMFSGIPTYRNIET